MGADIAMKELMIGGKYDHLYIYKENLWTYLSIASEKTTIYIYILISHNFLTIWLQDYEAL